MIRWFLTVLAIATLGGCGGSVKQGASAPMSEAEALDLAVMLANDQCERHFGVTPFERSTYRVRFEDGHWKWGGLDVAGIHGFSAFVSFDARGENRHVEIYLSTDLLTPVD